MGVLYNVIGCYVVGGRGCVGRGCAGVGGYGRGVGVVAVFSAPTLYPHSHILCRYIAQAATPLHSATLKGSWSARDPCQIPRGGGRVYVVLSLLARQGVVGALGLNNVLYKLPIKHELSHKG